MYDSKQRWTSLSASTLAAFVVLSVTPAWAQVPWGDAVLTQPPEWYQSAEARADADSVIQYQSPEGGWLKNTDLTTPPASPNALGEPTIDNDATTRPMQFLARMFEATGEDAYRKSFDRGMEYLLAAQYPNGGWPQFYPLREGYYTHITYNDNAMINVMTLLRDASTGAAPYGFVSQNVRTRAAEAVERGIDVILKTQVRQNGHLTAWCAQYDEVTLKPAWARAYEPPSLSGGESVRIVEFLMAIDKPTPEIIASIEGAVEWMRASVIHGIRIDVIRRDDGRPERVAVADPNAPPLWARFYELVTNRPLFVDRDSVYRYDYSQISYERRSGYSYYGTWEAALLAEEYPAWRARHGLDQ